MTKIVHPKDGLAKAIIAGCAALLLLGVGTEVLAFIALLKWVLK